MMASTIVTLVCLVVILYGGTGFILTKALAKKNK